jgi:hypothetical protein
MLQKQLQPCRYVDRAYEIVGKGISAGFRRRQPDFDAETPLLKPALSLGNRSILKSPYAVYERLTYFFDLTSLIVDVSYFSGASSALAPLRQRTPPRHGGSGVMLGRISPSCS